MLRIIGKPASGGIAIGRAFVFQQEALELQHAHVADSRCEIRRLQLALIDAEEQILRLRDKAAQEAGADEAAIFDAHVMLLKDPILKKEVERRIEHDGLLAEAAWMEIVERYANQMDSLEDEYLRARAADLKDVGERVARILMGIKERDLSELSSPSIVVAKDLTPSDTVRMPKSLVLGFCTAEGGPTSHAAVLAKAIGVPAIVGLGPQLLEIRTGEQLIVDGERGEVLVNPDRRILSIFKKKENDLSAKERIALSHAREPAITSDGYQPEIVANIGNIEDARTAIDHGAEGVGLLRTEFLFIGRTDAPDEDEQYKAYKAIFMVLESRPIVVRTIDIGGDKNLPYLDTAREKNPFLGWRAIRMCLDNPDFFKVQLRALLRAAYGHDMRIMFPMIATLNEVASAKELVDEVSQELRERGEKAAENYQLGIMAEVPAVTVMADQFAKEVDFFSIGTNDLTQYTMAAERTNERVAHLGDACHPAILRQIRHVVDAAHDEGIWVGLCGELAGDPDAVPILLGIGLDEFSMAPASIPRAKDIIRKWSKTASEALAVKALSLASAEEVRRLVRTFHPQSN